MHSGRWGVEGDDAWPPRSAPGRHNGRYVPDVNELDYTSAPRYHEVWLLPSAWSSAARSTTTAM